MKLSHLLLVLLITLAAPWPNLAASSRRTPAPTANWPADSTVKVYLVGGLFTNEQTKTLVETLDAWGGKVKNPAVKFVYAGQTGGLIDCLGCLTISRRQAYVSKLKRVSFEPIRYDEKGQLISAWIEFDNAVTSTQALRELMLEVLDREPGSMC